MYDEKLIEDSLAFAEEIKAMLEGKKEAGQPQPRPVHTQSSSGQAPSALQAVSPSPQGQARPIQSAAQPQSVQRPAGQGQAVQPQAHSVQPQPVQRPSGQASSAPQAVSPSPQGQARPVQSAVQSKSVQRPSGQASSAPQAVSASPQGQARPIQSAVQPQSVQRPAGQGQAVQPQAHSVQPQPVQRPSGQAPSASQAVSASPQKQARPAQSAIQPQSVQRPSDQAPSASQAVSISPQGQARPIQSAVQPQSVQRPAGQAQSTPQPIHMSAGQPQPVQRPSGQAPSASQAVSPSPQRQARPIQSAAQPQSVQRPADQGQAVQPQVRFVQPQPVQRPSGQAPSVPQAVSPSPQGQAVQPQARSAQPQSVQQPAGQGQVAQPQSVPRFAQEGVSTAQQASQPAVEYGQGAAGQASQTVGQSQAMAGQPAVPASGQPQGQEPPQAVSEEEQKTSDSSHTYEITIKFDLGNIKKKLGQLKEKLAPETRTLEDVNAAMEENRQLQAERDNKEQKNLMENGAQMAENVAGAVTGAVKRFPNLLKKKNDLPAEGETLSEGESMALDADIVQLEGEAVEEGKLAAKLEGVKAALPEKANKASRLFLNVVILLFCIGIAYFLASFVTNYVVHQTTVEGESMEPTLYDGDSVIIQRLSYYFRDPERYDVVVFPVGYEDTDGKDIYYIKRVIGLPGETVQIIDGSVYINGSELTGDNYALSDILESGIAEKPLVLGENQYFVMGDNRNMSTDSRNSYVGLVNKNDIVGEAWICTWPLSHFGGLKR